MTLASDYLIYARKIADPLEQRSVESFENLRLWAYMIQNSFYGVTIEPPKLHDGLEDKMKLLLEGDKAEWAGLLSSLTQTFPIPIFLLPKSEPIYHRLESLRRKIAA
jgi:hypothetical protein